MKKIFLIIAIFLLFSSSYSKSWHFNSIHIKATINPDGSMHIQEIRSYDFNGSFSWADYSLSGLENKNIMDFSLKDESGYYTENQSENEGSYFVETVANQFYVKWHYHARNVVKTFYLDYTISNVINSYNDVAELYWKFIGETNPEWADSVSIEVSLPRKASFGEVKAWAHGPLWGKVKFVHNKILLTVADLPKRQFIEARIIFPSQWVPESPAVGGLMEKNILNEEKDFAEFANRKRQNFIIEEQKRAENNARAYEMAMPAGLIIIIIFVFMYWRYGRGFEINYNQRIDANIPNEKHPALLNCIFFNNNITGSTLSTTLFFLAQKEILSIEKDVTTQKKWYDSNDPVIIKIERSKWQEQKSSLKDFENDLLAFFFETISGNEDQITSKQIKKASSKIQKWFRKWQKMIKVHLKENPYFEQESIKGAVINALLSLILLVYAIIILVNLGKNGLFAFIPALMAGFLSLTILRYTPDTKILKKKLQALRRYLKNFGTSSYEPSDLQRISDYFLFAIVLGIGKKYTHNILKDVSVEEQAILFPWFIYSGSGGPADFASAINSVTSAAATSVSSAAGAGGGMAAAGITGGGGAAGGAG